jgi:hypothetical protein
MSLSVVLLMLKKTDDVDWQKEGLQSAIDFTKFLLTLAGGAIAFVIQPTFFSGNHLLKTLAIGALFFLSACVISGLLVFSAGAVMLAKKKLQFRIRTCKMGWHDKRHIIRYRLCSRRGCCSDQGN